MGADRDCTVCGRPLENPSRASVCPHCLLLDVRHLLEEVGSASSGDLHAHSRGSPSSESSRPLVPHGAHESPGRYTGIHEHARGGMGRILLAHDVQLGRDVIIKELLGDRLTRQSTPPADRFVREARIAGQLEHPSIIPVHELGYRENGDLYYTMKYVQGVSLAESLESTVTVEERLRLLPHVLDVCQAIAYAHSRGVIHRDIKPANIMVGEFGETVVLDWGLARVKDADAEGPEYAAQKGASIDAGGAGQQETIFGEVLGTPAYMAPEQARGRADLVDERTDVYALGALLYTLLTGRPPHEAEDRDEIIRRATEGTPEPARALEPRAPAELVAICEKAMARDSSQRYPSVKALAEELQRFISGGRVAAYDYHLSEYLRRFARRHRRILAMATIAFILINVVVVYSYLHILDERNRAVEARNEALRSKEEVTRARDEATRSQLHAEQESYYRAIAYVHAKIQQGDFAEAPALLEGLPERFRGWEWGYLMGKCNLEERSVQAHEGVITAFAASHDGSLIATSGEDGNLILWNGKTLEKKWQYTQLIGITSLALTPDKAILAAGSDGVLLLNCKTGEIIRNTIPPRYDSDHMLEFAMSLNVTGAPEAGDTACVRFYPASGRYPSSREFGQAPFLLQNGDRVIRINLREASDPTRAKYEGAIFYFRITLPAPDKPKEFEMYRNMRVEIDWVAITDDPMFLPESGRNENDPFEETNPRLLHRAIWNFENDCEGWAPGKDSGAVVTHEDGKLVLTFEPSTRFAPSVRSMPSPERSPVESMAFDSEGLRLFELVDNHLRVRGTSDWRILKDIADVHPGTIPDQRSTAITLSPDGEQIVAAATVDGADGLGNYYRCFDTRDYASRWSVHDLGDDNVGAVNFLDLSFDPEGLNLLSLDEGRARVRSTKNGNLTGEWRVRADSFPAKAPKAIWTDQKHFLISRSDGAVVRFSTESDKSETILQNPSRISALAVHHDDGRLTTFDIKGTMRSWVLDGTSMNRGYVDLQMSGRLGKGPLQFSSDGSFLTILRSQSGSGLWSTDTAEIASIPFSDEESILGFRSGTDEVALRALGGLSVLFRNVKDGRVQREIALSQPLSTGVFAMDGTGRYMALGTESGFNAELPVEVFEISTGRKLSHDQPVKAGRLVFSEDGRYLAIDRKFEGSVEIWSIPECRPYRTLSDIAEGPYALRGMVSMAFHPTEAALAAATGTGRLVIWNYLTGSLVTNIPSPSQGVLSICFSPDGKRLVTGGDDGAVRVWDWRGGQQVLDLQDNDLARDVAFSRDGFILASGGGAPPVRMRIAWPRSATLLPEIQRRKNCHAYLIALDDARLDWAMVNCRSIDDASATIADLAPYLTGVPAYYRCMSGGEYHLASVQWLPSCSVHGAPLENPSLREKVAMDQEAHSLFASVVVARFCESERVVDMVALAYRWIEQNRHLPLAIRLLKRATDLAPEGKANWRKLGLAELRCGHMESALTHFRNGFEPDSEPAAVGLALALITRGTNPDLAEACALLEAQPGTSPTVYTEDALLAVDALPEMIDPRLRERIRVRLQARIAP